MIGDLIAPTHLLLILIVALIVLGPKRLPEVGKSLGKGLRDFREAMSNYSPEGLLSVDDPPPARPANPYVNTDTAPPPAAATAQAAPATETAETTPATSEPETIETA